MLSRINRKWFLLVGGILALAAILSGCGGGGGDKTGSVSVYMTDAAALAFDHVYITVDSVQIHTGDGWKTIPSSLGKIDLLSSQFRYHQQLIGSEALPVGHYDQTRLVLSNTPGACQVVLSGETEARNLVIPSGAQTGLKLIGSFDVAAGQAQAITIDFAPDKMIHWSNTSGGSYMLRPTCPMSTAANAAIAYGGLTGKVMPAEAWPTAKVAACDPVSGSVIAVTSVVYDPSNPSENDGTFRLLLPPGSYLLKVTADGFQSSDSTGTPSSWSISTGTDQDAGVITLTTPTTTPEPTTP